MLISKKIRLILTPEQEHYCWRASGTARWAYNQYIATCREMYLAKKNDPNQQGFITAFSFNKEITQMKKTKKKLSWLKDIAACVTKTAVINGQKAYDRFFKGLSKFPQFHAKRKTTPSFAMQSKSFKVVKHGCKIEKLGVVRTAEPIPKSHKDAYKNVVISFDNKYWYVSFSYEIETQKEELTNVSVGIDLGIKVLAMLATTDNQFREFKNINKTAVIKRLGKRLKCTQRSLSRKIAACVSGYMEKDSIDKNGNPCKVKKPIWIKRPRESKNFNKNIYKIQRLHRRLRCIRNNYLHQVTTSVVKAKPYRIVLEDLQVKALMKNKHLSKAIQDQKWYEFRRQITYKAQRYGIEVIIVPKNYPSSKTCSRCGAIKHDLQLKDRVYICEHCGLKINRDLNAAINLANYKI